MKEKVVNTQSTVNIQGDQVTQVIHFVGGIKRTYTGIKPDTIKQGQFTKMMRKDGSMLMVNDSNVLCIEVYKEK